MELRIITIFFILFFAYCFGIMMSVPYMQPKLKNETGQSLQEMDIEWEKALARAMVLGLVWPVGLILFEFKRDWVKMIMK